MSKFAIFDKNHGLLQWLGDGQTPMEVLTAFDDDVGIDPCGAGLSLDDWTIYDVTKAEAGALEEWAEAGSPADEFPLGDTQPI